MNDSKKTKKELVDELKKLRKRIAGLEKSQSKNKRIEQELIQDRAMFESFMDNIPMSVYFKDKKGRFLRVSKHYLEQCGIPEVNSIEEIIGKTDFDLFPEDLAKADRKDELHIMKTGEPTVDREERAKTAEGQDVYLLVNKAPFTDDEGKVIGILGITRDIAELKKREEELIEARKEAQKASLAKSTFLAIMSHEIRTPLNAIIGMCEILEETVLSKEQHDYLKVLREAGEALLAIINDVLDISKIECGDVQIEKSEFSLDALVEKVCDILAIRAHKKGIELVDHISPNVPINLIGDSYHVRQVLVNLIGNSIKFTDKGEVVLNIKLAKEEGYKCDIES